VTVVDTSSGVLRKKKKLLDGGIEAWEPCNMSIDAVLGHKFAAHTRLATGTQQTTSGSGSLHGIDRSGHGPLGKVCVRVSRDDPGWKYGQFQSTVRVLTAVKQDEVQL